MVAGSICAEAGTERWAGVVSAAVHVQVRGVHAVQPGARAGASRHARDHRVLPGGLAVQMRQQALRALTCSALALTRKACKIPMICFIIIIIILEEEKLLWDTSISSHVN